MLVLLAISSALVLRAAYVDGAGAPRGATRVAMLTVTAKAPCTAAEPLRLSALHLRHEGLGDVSDIDAVYVLEDGVRRSRAQSFDRRSSEATVRLRGVAVLPCTERMFTVAVSFSAQAAAGAEHRVTLLGATAADGTIAPVAAPPVRLPQTRVVPFDVDPPTLRMLERTNRISYGSGRTLARFVLAAGSDDLSIEALTFANAGSAKDADLQNVRIVNAKGESLTAVEPSMQGSELRFTFDPPLTMERSGERLLEVRGDVRASVRRTVRLFVEEDSDIVWTVLRRRR